MRRRILLIGLGAVLLGVVAGLALLVATLRPDSLKPRIINAVRDATGRELTLAGPLHLSWSLIPTLVADDVRLANPPDLSRPDMLTAARVEARVALLPLLSRRVELRRVLLVQPDLLLEADATGRPNWRLDRASRPAPAGASPAAGSRAGVAVSLQGLRIEAGQVAYRPAAGEPVRAGITTLTADAAAPDAPVAVVGAITLRDAAFTVRGTTGSVLALSTGAAWPVRVEAEGGGLALRAEGAVGAGAALAVEARAPDLARLSSLAGRPLPPLRDVEATARLTGGALAGAALRVGGIQLAPGIRLEALALDAPEPAAPVALTGALDLGGTPVRLSGTVGTLAALLAGSPVLADLRADASAGATASVRGTLAEPRALRGLDALVSARVPDLAALGPAAGDRLPALRDLALDARLTDPAGLAQGVAVGALRLSSSIGDLSGDLAATWAPRLALRGALLSQRLDVVALQVALRRPPPTDAPPSPSPVEPKAGSTDAAVVLPRNRLFPDEALPFDALRAADADLRLGVTELALPGATLRDVETRLVLQGGTLRLDPFTASAPGGQVEGALLLDAAGPEPAAALTLRSPGLALGPLLAAFGWPEGGSGSLELDLDLRGVGPSPRALAATLTGHLGAALVDGELDGEALSAALGEALRRASLPVELGGRVALRCLALRADAASGAVALPALLVDTARLHVEGGGTMDLGAETLDLRLRPVARLGGAGVELPLRVGGTLLAPRAGLDAGPSGRVGVTVGPGAPHPTDACAAQLALARGGRAGAMPAAAAPETARPVNPVDLLRNLLRRP